MQVFLANFLSLIQQILVVMIFIRVILSWLKINIKFIHDTTEWILQPIRKMLPPIGGMLDLSPLLAILLIQVLGDILIGLLVY